MREKWKQLKEGAIEREEAFEDKCAIHAMQALIANGEDIYDTLLGHSIPIEEKAFEIAWKMSQERRDYSSDWGWIVTEEPSTTD
jgi:hypothetical protein